jgi:extracellular factor (EF) 3-hydroxypalmitic acid methyl ester biosynthesis protein
MHDRAHIVSHDTDLTTKLIELARFVERQGPAPEEYERLAALFDQIALVRGSESPDLIDTLLRASGGAFNSVETNQGFVCLHPHGYYGDYEIIDRIYTNYVCPDPALEKWDLFFQWTSAARAVRARKDYCLSLMRDLVRRQPQGATILNVASGPGRDVYEFFVRERRDSLMVHCVDQDQNALAHASRLLQNFSRYTTFECANVLRWRPRQKYDLVWCAGLFDYLTDSLFVHVLRRLAFAAQAHGSVVIGNFSEENPHRNYMEFGGWKLIHRSKDQLLSLFEQARLPDAKAWIGMEPNRVNLFLHIELGGTEVSPVAEERV